MITKESKDNFLALYSLTLTICNLWTMPPAYSKGVVARWADLADIWVENGNALGCGNIFFPVVHKIHWGIYPDGVSRKELFELFALIETELLSDGCAYRAWRNRFEYRMAFHSVVSASSISRKPYGPRSHTRSTDRYLYCRTFNAVVYKDTPPGPLDLVTASGHDIQSARAQAQIHAYCHGFEHVIKKILPQAETWTYKQWSNDLNITRGLKKAFGINYLYYGDAFDALIEFLVHQWYYGTENNLGRVINIKTLPIGIAQIIWPENTAEKIEGMFLKAYQRVKSVEGRRKGTSKMSKRHKSTFSYANLKKSWLYKQVQAWVDDGTFTAQNHAIAKRAVFELGMV